MSMTWSTISEIHPKTIEALWFKQLQGKPVATQFLRERQVKTPTFVYRFYGNLGGMTPLSSDLSGYRMSSTQYSEQSATCKLYKEKDLISEQAIKFSADIRDVVQDATNHLIERLVLRTEWLVINAMVSNAGTIIDLSDGDGTRWNEENANPLDDLVEARRVMQQVGFTSPDTLLINSDTEADLLRNVDLKEWQRVGPLGQGAIRDGSIGRLRGMDIFVSNIFFIKDEHTSPAKQQRLKVLNNKAIAFKQDPELGFMAVAMPFSSKTWEDQEHDGVNIGIKKMFVPVITRPQYIVVFDNVRAQDF